MLVVMSEETLLIIAPQLAFAAMLFTLGWAESRAAKRHRRSAATSVRTTSLPGSADRPGTRNRRRSAFGARSETEHGGSVELDVAVELAEIREELARTRRELTFRLDAHIERHGG
ncbi:MAG: hypothetical protein ACRDUY_07210 [Nitriliruptorales bacterium]